ncbi:DUF3422 family protein [Azohydromonas australica]|uniref:DUF3422 family protein n=1 Tax=Azohydromonas australica TaxID=364039 RepID=UPI0009FBA476|nr:DUF3422 domain-containing protein [Azohydromonas australica]
MSHPELPIAHAQRAALHNEIHARPPEAMALPLAISHVVMTCDAQQRELSRHHLAVLLRNHHLPPPDAQCSHLRADLGGFRLRWELHTEFVTWTFSRPLHIDREPSVDLVETLSASRDTAYASVPQEWVQRLPGRTLSAMHLWVLPDAAADTSTTGCSASMARRLMNEEMLVASGVAHGQACIYSDFAIHADGFSRMLLLCDGLDARRLGRLVQRLLEIETYRMAALLALPAARKASGLLADAERELAALSQAIQSAQGRDEQALLDRLTRLAAQVESHYAQTHARFSASAAYFELLDRRLKDIAESPLPGLQTVGRFLERRMSPARSTCAWTAHRQDALSQRVSRVSNLLRTRVEIEQQLNSQALLKAMNERQQVQLQLQSAVEGLSVAAITYYIVGLAGYLAKGAQKAGLPLNPELTSAAAIPLVALCVWLSIRRIHKRLARDRKGPPAQVHAHERPVPLCASTPSTQRIFPTTTP